MESTGTMMEGGEWSSINGVSVNEEADFMAQFFPNYSFITTNDQPSLNGFLTNSFYSSDHDTQTTDDSNIYSFSLGSSSSYSSGSDGVFYPSCHENYYLPDSHNSSFLASNDDSLPIDFCLTDQKSFLHIFPGNTILEGDDINLNMNQETSCGNFEEHPLAEIEPTGEDTSRESFENASKRTRVSDTKGKRNVRSKKNQRVGSDDEDNGPALKRQNSNCCSSEDDSNGCQELNAAGDSSSKETSTLNLSGKTRASRGSATDPQSLYARKRRERINERLRILQNLVPNGTKVDISTMLEEAVQYVKFLQLQIKLLSSDEMWMYAPLAYNGMDIGLDLNTRK